MFHICSDKMKDVSKIKEQIRVCIRYVHKATVYEGFLGYTNTTKPNSLSLSSALSFG